MRRLDIEEVGAVIERCEEAAKTHLEKERLREAAIAVAFLWGSGHVNNFEDLMACFNPLGLPERVVSFNSPEQARTWLMQNHDNRRTVGVSVASVWHSVTYSLDRGVPQLIRVPTVGELTSARHATGTITDGMAIALHQAMPHARSPQETDSLLTALLALYFIVAAGQVSVFTVFLRDFHSRDVLAPFHVFNTRQEADSWLKSHPRPPRGARVEISGQRFSVGYDRESDLRVWARALSLEELGPAGPTDEHDR